jgi:hypothetical protein
LVGRAAFRPLLTSTGDGAPLRANLFPRKGAAETSGATGTRQIICRKGPERGCQTRFGTFAGKSQASFGQLPVILGDQHRVLALQPLAKGSRRCSFRGILPCRRDHRGRRPDPTGLGGAAGDASQSYPPMTLPPSQALPGQRLQARVSSTSPVTGSSSRR